MILALSKKQVMRIVCTGLCLSPLSFANAMLQPSFDMFKNSHLLDNLKQGNIIAHIKQGHILAELGDYIGKQGDNQHVNIPTLVGNQYTPHSSIASNILVGLGYEHAIKQRDKLNFSYGLSLSYLAPAQVTGNIYLENQLNNLTYSYQVSHLPLYAMLKASHALKNPKYKWIADIGLGPNFMFINDYNETPLLSSTVSEQAYSNSTTTTLSLTLGVGIEMSDEIKAHPIRCGYRFYYLGEGALNHNDKVTNALTTGPVYANAGVCSFVF